MMLFYLGMARFLNCGLITLFWISVARLQVISGTKYYFLEYEMDEDVIREINILFPYEVKSLDEVFKYL